MAVTRIDLSPEIQDWREASCGEEVRGAGISSLQKMQEIVNGTVKEVNQAAEQSNNTAEESRGTLAKATAALTNSQNAMQTAEDTRQDILNRMAAGEFKGDQGNKGEKGDQGESGVMAPASGMFSLYLDPATGDLYADYPTGEAPPQFEYDANTGDLYYVTG